MGCALWESGGTNPLRLRLDDDGNHAWLGDLVAVALGEGL